jgi:16S rRNA (cytosine1402-N4)-methyltransferase
MMASSDSKNAVAGGLARHIPVLGCTAVEFLAVRDGGVYVDATFGAGGYSRKILAAANSIVLAFDRDIHAVASATQLGRTVGNRLIFIQRKFSELVGAAHGAGYHNVDGVVFDVGLSSMQLADAQRGFSFRNDGPLDMRMGNEGPTAADILQVAGEQDLARIIAALGEERRARAVARAIVRARRAGPLESTRALADVICSAVHGRPGNIHPATRTFQALRIFVNDELAELAKGLYAAERLLCAGGRLVVITFHSLEDRIVKSFLAQRAAPDAGSRHLPPSRPVSPSFRLLNKRPVVASESEVRANPRARSAKLRAAERTETPPVPGCPAHLLPLLPSLTELLGGRR